MKPSALRIERLLAKVEAELACSARARRYVFHYDEVAEAEAQGLPYVLVPRVLSREEWEKKYSLPAQSSPSTAADPTPSQGGGAKDIAREARPIRLLGLVGPPAPLADLASRRARPASSAWLIRTVTA
jgi:hypothetical protein